MRMKHLFLVVGAALGIALVALAVGCDDTNAGADMTMVKRDMAMPAMPDIAGSGSMPDMVPPPPDLGCYPNPMVHYEIINGCTTAQPIDKNPKLPLLGDGGSLPPLP